MKRPLLIITMSTALAAAALSTPASACDPVPGALIGGGIGAAIGHAPGAAIGAIIGSAITGGAPCYSYGHGPAPAYVERGYDRGYVERGYDRGYAEDRRYEPRYAEPAYYAPPAPAYYAPPAPVYYAPPPVYYAPAVVYRSYPAVRYVSYGYRSHRRHDRWR